ncbi:MAG: hypothetical protein H0Z35_03215 [Thermoanaerobacteraceae bacterium]|nr:hypothetical protein [Thermoanaerobacteraceae bacterium]
MYAGHLGIALFAKGIRRNESLLLLIIASIFIDLTTIFIDIFKISLPSWFMLHTIPSTIILAVCFGLVIFIKNRNWRQCIFFGVVIISHLLVDYLTSRLSIWAKGPVIGLGLYKYPLIDFILEGTFIVFGWLVYQRIFKNQKNKLWALWLMLFILIGLQACFSFLICN